NAFMDALAHERRLRGLPSLSINWGAWDVAGMAAALGVRDQRRWVEQGLSAMSPDEGVAALQQLLGSARTQVTVLSMDWRRYREQFAHASVPAFLSRVAEDPATRDEIASPRRAAWLRVE